VCVSEVLEEPFRRCLSEYMYDPPHIIHFCVAAYRLLPLRTDHFVLACECVKGRRRCLFDYMSQSIFLTRIHTPVLCDRPYCFPCVCETGSCVRNIWRGVQAMPIWIHLWSAVHSPFFLASYRLWPFQTDHLFNRVCMCEEQLNRRWGESYFNQCIICRAQSIFFWLHTDSCRLWPTIFVLACVCVRSTWGAVQAMPIWIHVWSAAHDPFFVLPHTDCFLFWLIFIVLAWECVTGRWRGLQAMHIWIHVTTYFFGPHTDPCLFWPTIFFLAFVCVTGSWTGVQAMPFWIHV